jgi:integrase
MSVHIKPDGQHYVSYRDEYGKQHTKTYGKGKQARLQAESFDLKLQAMRKLGERPLAKSEVYLDGLAQDYVKDRKLSGVSDAYLKDLRDLLNNHVLPLLCHKPVDELTYDDMLRVADHYKDRSQSTRNRYLGYLRAIFRWGIRHGITKNNPLMNWQKTKEAPRRSQLTVEDLKKLIEHAEPHLRWALEVEWNLGTRPGPSELLSIKWEHVDPVKGVVWIYATKTKDWRDIPISEEFMKQLLAKQEKAETVYVIEYRGKPMKKFRRSFGTACKRAGITYPCRMYDVRHLFASAMLAGGGDLAAVSKLLGHSTTQMTADVYYDLMKGEKARAIGLLPKLTEEP